MSFPSISGANTNRTNTNRTSTNRANHRAHVSAIREVAPKHYQVRLKAAQLAKAARPGQFIHVLTTPDSTGWTFDPLLRRAFSIMSVNSPDEDSIDLLFRVEGKGTAALSKARVGDEIDIIGPLGQPFDISPFGFTQIDENPGRKSDNMFHVKQQASSAIVVGGGVGVPPLVYLSQALAKKGVDVHSIIGARGASEIIGWHELSAACQGIAITTDDGSRGHHGRVTDLLTALIEQLIVEQAGQTIKPIVYSCGPLPMLRAVAQICSETQVRCQVSMEENMPCGIGVCNGCVVRTRQPFADSNGNGDKINAGGLTDNRVVGSEWSPYRAYRRVCVEGPACWADEIDWEHQG